MPIPISTPPTLTAKDIARFWRLVDCRGPDECWPWRGFLLKGYGRFPVTIGVKKQRILRAHRVALLITTGRWAPELVLHSCDYRACCNPNHLREGTHQDNINDFWQRNPPLPHKWRKLEVAQVRCLRNLMDGGMPVIAAGKLFHLSEGAAYAIRERLTWAWIEPGHSFTSSG